MRPPVEVDLVEVSAELVAFADERLADLRRRCLEDEDDDYLLRLARSCYLQGLCDGAETCVRRPDVAALLRDILAGLVPKDEER